MCLICIEFIKGNLTSKEALSNSKELTDEVHVKEVENLVEETQRSEASLVVAPQSQ